MKCHMICSKKKQQFRSIIYSSLIVQSASFLDDADDEHGFLRNLLRAV